MITSTSIKHYVMKDKIDKAIKSCVAQSYKSADHFAWHDIKNRKGEVTILVRHSRNHNDGLSFYDSRLKNITNVVLKALRG